MNESPPTRSPALLATARGRQLRSTSDTSPTRQRKTDDILSNLTPRTVVDAFRNPSGSLKACMQAATPAEQAFALRVAIASNSIYEWLEELSAWPWPAGGTSAGFEIPTAKTGRLFHSGSEPSADEAPRPDQEYIGSLPAADVARYERRLDEIAQGLEELDIEEIKRQVLNNHIMPLSRPGTPVMDSSRSATSALSSVAMLDDLAALITATTVQALPNISKLAKLMNTWNFRLLVLRKIPVFLASLTDAEVALRSGWNAIGLDTTPDRAAGNLPNGTAGTGPATLSREDFDVMKTVLGRKVAKAGRDLDSMLDILEGQPDTLPEEWIDRLDALELGYSEWSVAGERKVKEADLARSASQAALEQNSSEQPAPLEPNLSAGASSATSGSLTSASPKAQAPEAATPLNGSSTRALGHAEVLPPLIKIHPTAEEHELQPEDDCPDTDDEELAPGAYDRVSSVQQSGSRGSSPADTAHDYRGEDAAGADGSPSNSEIELSGISEHQAPPSESRGRRDSDVSQSSTVMQEASSIFTDSFSSDLDHGTPERPRQQATVRDGDISGFPSFRSSTRSMSVSFNDQPSVAELPSFPSPPSTPTKSVILEDDVATEPDSPSEISMPRSDDQLQQQISEILESVPAKIRLTAEPPPVNLNPPDFKMPTARKSSRPDAIPRSQSSLSMRSAYSRSGTPSFTLAPAYGRSSRPRHQRTNQDIKLYHLSRSNGEAPIKLFIRCVGEHGERVMVRVGGGWADLGEYLKEYASHHLRRSAGGGVDDDKVEVKDIPRTGAVRADSPPSRPASALDVSHHHAHYHNSPESPLRVRKTRRPTQHSHEDANASNNSNNDTDEPSTSTACPKTPLAPAGRRDATPPSDGSSRSRSSSRFNWLDDDGDLSALGMAGPRAKHIEMSEERRAWVESVKEKVRIASGERKVSLPLAGGAPPSLPGSMVAAGGGGGGPGQGQPQGLEASLMDRDKGGAVFGEMGKVGSTKRLFRRG
ncbi:562b136d-b473-4e18-9feb-87c95234be40 [Thermothielavioides terrestris]|uniref:GAR domain-containing protein n=2 Tax=Thermothielavioides terrestris TaxID=2587410 RepID=G2QSU4_THETT|nr:uncharacterized protein THITE_2107113 [Thermothielavioides terrestris NRRL 8126]AEO62669.1 hypothetical protein THITE_2107113 [Thermothielavioides terrestris NRRL 8126]SPQ21834.1 562b136d-b473-4e18-9feb-87c95234be40 [Thermothielavioides terrestris]